VISFKQLARQIIDFLLEKRRHLLNGPLTAS